MRMSAATVRLGVAGAVGGALMGGCGHHPRALDVSPNDPGIRDASEMSAATEPLGELEFLAGQWRMLEGKELSEEVWSVPHGNSIIGMFRLTGTDGGLRVHETLAITAMDGGVWMRLRHFDVKMTAREEKDAPIVLKLESAAGQRAVFRCTEGSQSLATITYWREQQTLHSEVAFTPESKRETLKFAMRRLGAYPF